MIHARRLVLAAALVMIAARPGVAQERGPSQFRGVELGSKLKVMLRDGSSQSGRVGEVTDQQLVLLRGPRLDPVVYRHSWTDVDALFSRKGGHGTVGALLGGIGGVVVGFALEEASCSGAQCPQDEAAGGVRFLFYGLVGAAVGAAFGALIPNWVPLVLP
jgi:hypothetical protein